MIPVTYIGFSYELIHLLIHSKEFKLEYCILQNGRISDELLKMLEEREIDYSITHSMASLNKCMESIKTKYIIMCKFGYIIPQVYVSKYKIFNIHLGNIETNRGAHSLIWSILSGMDETCASIYRLGKKIDLGVLIDTYKVTIEETDDTLSLEKKLITGYPQLLHSLFLFINKQMDGKEILAGLYRKKVEPIDYTIDLEKDDIRTIQRKINSQKQYDGAILKIGKFQFRVKDMKITEL